MKQKTENSSNSTEKLQKILASAGLGSRREMEQAITDGRVLLNGVLARLGDRAGSEDTISLDGRPIPSVARKSVRRVLIYNKPEGEVCSRKDPDGRPTVFDHLPKVPGERWVAVGRLDINTSGLLLFTNDGELANTLMHPSSNVEREYAVRVLGDVNIDMIQRMHEGVQLEDGVARFTDIQEFGGRGANVWYHVVIMEGRNREVRRLWESQGVQVSRLKRVRYGSVFMDPDVRAGTWKEMDKKAVDLLAQSVGLPSKPWASLFSGKNDRLKRQSNRQRTRRHVSK
ncbi:23S rRNA pseudouridine(2605) synthase RluB [Gynuella sunshinyii]|uniref:Pseudouridine synthase n=1 Tax=Gynuella sunshinyii YC6258 TaxID=1445510 RepID=A0A0C5VQB7_9GAMM|nr:pseudouridine synthase [Gynuella sunshinyii]AJQ96461.1 16S rRNA uridine-516 pseudouridylate synthase and related pseudouridylate synthase [Gynuella sunshinyii YC6258]